MSESQKITPKQGIFIARYLIHGNATKAAEEAGCPQLSAHVTGSRWLKNAKVAAVIAERRARLEDRLLLTAEQVDRELAKVIVFDPRGLVDDAGNPLPLQELDEITRSAIAALEVDVRRVNDSAVATHKYKIADRLRAMEMFYRRRGLLTDKRDDTVKVTLEELVGGAA